MTVWSTPAVGVVAGRAVVAAGSYDKNLYLLDAATGAEIWKYTTGEGVYGTPLITEVDGRPQVFFTSSDRLLYALDADSGAREWIYAVADFRSTLGSARLSGPALGQAGDVPALFFGHWVWDRSLANNAQEGGVTAVDARTGARLWRQLLGDNEMTAVVYAGEEGGRLFVGSSSGNLFALEAATGKVIWQRTELDAIRSAPAYVVRGEGGRLLSASKSGLVRCLDAHDGHELWRYKVGDWVTGSPAVATVRGRDLVFVSSYDRSTYALDFISGQLVWRHSSRGALYASPVLVPAVPPVVLVAGWDHLLSGIHAQTGEGLFRTYTGRPLWNTVGLEHSAWSSPTAARVNGTWMIYFGSYSGVLQGFVLDELLALGKQGSLEGYGFWLSLPVSLCAVAGAAWLLTFRERRRARSRAQVTTKSSGAAK